MSNIGILLSNLKTAYTNKSLLAKLPSTKPIRRILALFRDLGFINAFESTRRACFVTLKYNPAGDPSIRSIMQISRPGSRVFISYKQLSSIGKNCSLNNPLQVIILSTPHGIITHHSALLYKVGGEVLLVVN
jgi:ribosomal protein S8